MNTRTCAKNGAPPYYVLNVRQRLDETLHTLGLAEYLPPGRLQIIDEEFLVDIRDHMEQSPKKTVHQ